MSPRRAAPAATRANANANANANVKVIANANANANVIANADQATNDRNGPNADDAIFLGTTLPGTTEFTSALGVGVRSCIAILQNKT